MANHLLTSESVTEGHPDKIADQISDSVLDAVMAVDPMGRVACETMVTTGLAIVAGEITTDAVLDTPRIVRRTIRDIGYTRAKYGFDCETCAVMVSLDEQSPDIAQGVDPGGAGDQGLMYGFACTETPELPQRRLARGGRAALAGDQGKQGRRIEGVDARLERPAPPPHRQPGEAGGEEEVVGSRAGAVVRRS